MEGGLTIYKKQVVQVDLKNGQNWSSLVIFIVLTSYSVSVSFTANLAQQQWDFLALLHKLNILS